MSKDDIDSREQSQDFQENVVRINRCATVVKGGRRFSFSALVVVGNRDGTVGIGFGKANEVPSAVDKGKKDAMKARVNVPIVHDTIPHEVVGRFGAARVVLRPAAPGTGVIAGESVRAVLDLAGVRNILTKCFGTTNKVNVVKATMNGLLQLRTREEVARLRGLEL